MPVGAVVPQFYGYYEPDEYKRGAKREEFMSPILLLEHCGEQINLSELEKDDKCVLRLPRPALSRAALLSISLFHKTQV